MSTPRYDFYESDERVIISIYDRGVRQEDAKTIIEARKLSYEHGDKSIVFDPLKSQIVPDKSTVSYKSTKVEIQLAKTSAIRWGTLVGETPDVLATMAPAVPTTSIKPRKNWEAVTTNILESEKEISPDQDPNVGGDASVNTFFQKLFKDADDDTKKAMMKSYQESGGTALSTNWDEVKKEKVQVKPPADVEYKKWG